MIRIRVERDGGTGWSDKAQTIWLDPYDTVDAPLHVLLAHEIGHAKHGHVWHGHSELQLRTKIMDEIEAWLYAIRCCPDVLEYVDVVVRGIESYGALSEPDLYNPFKQMLYKLAPLTTGKK